MTISDINTEARLLCDATSTQYTDADLLRRVNAAYEEIVGKLIVADGRWDFDDTNYTDLPIATTTLVAGQQDYSFADNQLEVQRVEVLNAVGHYVQITPIDKSDKPGIALSEYQSTPGMPAEYDKNGGSVVLYPPPAAASVTLAAGLKVYFQRTASTFTSGDVSTGTKQPGFASPFHIILAYKMALPYCMTYKKDRVALYVNEITRLEKELLTFYAHRQEDERPIMSMAPINFR